MMVKTLIAVTAVAILAGCQQYTVKDENSWFYSIKPGAVVTLKETLDIAPNQVSVYMQHGRKLAANAVDLYDTHCKFEIRTIAESTRQVSPDDFRVTKVSDQSEVVSLQGRMFASMDHDYDVRQDISYTTTLYLSSDSQPDVLRLTCMQQDSFYYMETYPSIAQMRKALGDVFEIQLNDS